MQGIDEKTSHLVNYLDKVNQRGLPPKGLGMIHRRGHTDQIKLCRIPLDGYQMETFAESVHRAKFVTKIILKDCGLTDKEGLLVITKMNQSLVRHLDFSQNAGL